MYNLLFKGKKFRGGSEQERCGGGALGGNGEEYIENIN